MTRDTLCEIKDTTEPDCVGWLDSTTSEN